MAYDLDVFEKFHRIASTDQLIETLQQHALQMGFNAFFYAPIRGQHGAEKFFDSERPVVEVDELVRQQAFTNYPPAWIHRYQEAGHTHIDPVVRRRAVSHLPVYWDEAARHSGHNRVFHEAREHGLTDGITVPVCGPQGERALLSLASSTAGNAAPKERLVMAGLVVLTALHLQEAVQRLSASGGGQTLPSLTARELECLRWAAAGKTSSEIAANLTIAERTVIFHIANATKKLGAANRRQAVVRALSMGLIAP